MEPHQQRVVDEANELEDIVEKEDAEDDDWMKP